MQIKLLQSSYLFDCDGKPQTTKEVGCKRGLKGAQRIQQVWGGFREVKQMQGYMGCNWMCRGARGGYWSPGNATSDAERTKGIR